MGRVKPPLAPLRDGSADRDGADFGIVILVRQGEHLGDVPVSLRRGSVEPVALQGSLFILKDLSATLREVRSGAVAQESAEGDGGVPVVLVEGADGRDRLVLVGF